jgi:hypothetical protein
MRIAVARGTGLFLKVKLRRGDSGYHSGAVAFHARDGQVRPFQREPRFLVIGQREFRRPVSLKPMAAFALVQIGCGQELSLVLIGVTIQAAPESNLVLGCCACRGVTIGAGNRRVFAQERIL